MDQKLLCIGCIVLASLCGMTLSKNTDPDFVEENGKALQHLRVLPGVRRSVNDLQTAEEAAGKAVLHLLDAKIGKKVSEAAKEVTDYLNGAIGQHAKVRADKLHSNKDKELSLLSITAGKKAADKHTAAKKKKESFLLNFKIPYLVTPVKNKKKHHKKKFHGHKHHHHKHHHKAHHKPYHPKILNTHPNPPHPAVQPHPVLHPPPAQAQPQHGTQSQYNAVDLMWDGYNWSARPVNATTSAGGMTLCEGPCMDPCSAACNLQSDCCCCPSGGSIAPQAPLAPQPSLQAPPPNFLSLAPSALPATAPAQAAPTQCLPICKRSCLSYCPERCCGFQGKRNKVAESPENSSGSGSGSEDKP